jgi:hypothetical protein
MRPRRSRGRPRGCRPAPRDRRARRAASLPVRRRAEPQAGRPAHHPLPASLPQANHEIASQLGGSVNAPHDGRDEALASQLQRIIVGATPRSTSTTARPSPRYTAARRAEPCSFESISLCVMLRCQPQAVAHHPRRERRRLASASPVSCAGAVLWMSQARTSRHLSAPQRLARVARLVPRRSRRSWRPEIPPRRTSPRSLKCWAASGPRFRSHAAGRCARSGKRGAASGGRLSAVAGCGDHTIR